MKQILGLLVQTERVDGPAVVPKAASSSACCRLARCSLPVLRQALPHRRPGSSSAEPPTSAFTSSADLSNHAEVLRRAVSRCPLPRAPTDRWVWGWRQRGRCWRLLPGTPAVILRCPALRLCERRRGSNAWLRPSCVSVSLRQTGLKKETGGTEVERSHERKNKCKTESTISVRIWGVEGKGSTVQLL